MDFSVKDDLLTPQYAQHNHTPAFSQELSDLLPPLQPMHLTLQQQHMLSSLAPYAQPQSPILCNSNEMSPLQDSPDSSSDLDSTDRTSKRLKKKLGGRKVGSQGYTKQDIGEVLDLIEGHKPVGREGWEQVAQAYSTYALQNGRQSREPENLKKKFMSLVNYRKAPDDPDCPEDARRAKKINPVLEREMQALGYGDEETELDDEGRKRKISSDPLERSNVYLRKTDYLHNTGNSSSPSFTSMSSTSSNPSPATPSSLSRHLGLYLSQLVQQVQQQQQQHQLLSQQQATVLAGALAAQQQAHQAFMLHTLRTIGSRPGDFRSATQLAALLPPEWNAAAVLASVQSSSTTNGVESLMIEEWTRSVSPEILPDSIKTNVLAKSRGLGVETLRDLLDLIETFSCSDLEEMLGLKPPDINRLKKALAHLAPRLLEETSTGLSYPKYQAELLGAPS